MKNWAIKLSIFINYWVFALLLNSVGTVILQVQNSFDVSASSASVLEAFKDISIAVTCFLVASFISRVGYKMTMLFSLAFVSVSCLTMTQLPFFWMTKVLFATVGISFALIKVSVFATLGLIANGKREHASLMNFLESFFMVGVVSGYFIFGSFIDNDNPGSLVWLNVYYLLSVLSVFAFILLLFSPLDESNASVNSSNDMNSLGQKNISLVDEFIAMIKLSYRPLVMIFIVSVFLYVLIEQSIMSWLPTFNSKILNLSTALSIQMASILAASTALGRFVAGFVLKKWDWFGVLMVSLFCAACLVLIALPLTKNVDSVGVDCWSGAPLVAFLFPLIGFCLAPIYPAINSVVLSALPVREHASMAGLIVVFSALGGTTGSLITGTLFQYLGGELAFYFSLVPISLVAVSLYLFKAQLKDE